jgi:hypothetical protein
MLAMSHLVICLIESSRVDVGDDILTSGLVFAVMKDDMSFQNDGADVLSYSNDPLQSRESPGDAGDRDGGANAARVGS